MRITKWGELGVLALSYLAHHADFKNANFNGANFNDAELDSNSHVENKGMVVGAAAICETLNVDIDYTRQVLQRLKNSGLINTTRGPHGGYRLARPAHLITLEDILIATEGAAFEIVCESKPVHESCGEFQNQCNLKALWTRLGDHISEFLTRNTLQDILDIDPSWTPGTPPPLVQLSSVNNTGGS